MLATPAIQLLGPAPAFSRSRLRSLSPRGRRHPRPLGLPGGPIAGPTQGPGTMPSSSQSPACACTKARAPRPTQGPPELYGQTRVRSQALSWGLRLVPEQH